MFSLAANHLAKRSIGSTMPHAFKANILGGRFCALSAQAVRSARGRVAAGRRADHGKNAARRLSRPWRGSLIGWPRMSARRRLHHPLIRGIPVSLWLTSQIAASRRSLSRPKERPQRTPSFCKFRQYLRFDRIRHTVWQRVPRIGLGLTKARY
jgi:hypothetical protein